MNMFAIWMKLKELKLLNEERSTIYETFLDDVVKPRNKYCILSKELKWVKVTKEQFTIYQHNLPTVNQEFIQRKLYYET